jgi:hypothetical protein
MKKGIVRIADRDGFIRLHGDEAQDKLTPAELDYLADQDVVAVNSTYLGETLAVVVLFREAAKGFVDSDIATLKTISPLFALSLAGVVKAAQQEDGDSALDDTNRDEDRDSRHRDDWWKNGEAPPF